MESITIYPKNEKQKSLLKTLLEEMSVRFEISESDSQIIFTEDQYIEKINKSIQQAESGKTIKLKQTEQRDFLGL